MRYARGYEARDLFHPGQWVPEGLYREVRTDRVVRLDEEGMLPASLDGRVACYVQLSGPEKHDRTADAVTAGSESPGAGEAE